MQSLLSDQSSSLTLALILLGLFIILKEVLIVQSSRNPAIYYILMFPGIIIHELSHVLFCFLTLTKIKSVKLFSKTGGFVLHEKPAFIFVSFLISVAPLLVGLLLLYLLFNQVKASEINLADFNIKNIFLLYFLSSILITMLPSRQDVFNALSIYLAIIIGLACFFILSDEVINLSNINSLLGFCLIALVIVNLFIFIFNRFIWKSK